MKTILQEIIIKISEQNNIYRDSSSDAKTKLRALWEIGDILVKNGVDRPHSTGWAIQRETKGLIKRPTIFRSYKLRQIWNNKENMLRDIGNMKHISYLTAILPLIDPKQEVRNKLEAHEVQQIFASARANSRADFLQLIQELKSKYSHGKLGKPLDKSKYMAQIGFVIEHFSALQTFLLALFQQEESTNREGFRSDVALEELLPFANMCISLTTKENYNLYKKAGLTISNSKNQHFKILYDYFKSILDRPDDSERARVRRIISPEAFAQMSDIISSIRNEDGVKDFKSRQLLLIKL